MIFWWIAALLAVGMALIAEALCGGIKHWSARAFWTGIWAQIAALGLSIYGAIWAG